MKNYFSEEQYTCSISMAEKIPQHMHCQICGKAIPGSETEIMCSDECKQKYQAMVKKRKMYTYILYGAMIVILVFVLLSGMGGR